MPEAATDARQLLTDYVQTGSETAFRAIVASHLNLVYSAAWRLVDGDAHRAEDVAQIVFANLARLAPSISPQVILAGWLHRHACYVAANLMRTERRRRAREQRALAMNPPLDDCEPEFATLSPWLDSAINQLSDPDRAAILLRFFESRDFRNVGELMGTSEDTARARVNRALEKLRARLKRHGVTTSAGALALALTAHAVNAAPVHLAGAMPTAALLAKAAAVPAKLGLTLSLAKAAAAAITVAALGMAVFLALPRIHRQATAPATAGPTSNTLAAAYARYTRESFQPIPNKPAFFSYWRGEFSNALAVPGGSPVLRLRVMTELGSMQGTNLDEAKRIFRRVAAYAKSVGNLDSQFDAAQNLFHCALWDPMVDFTNTANDYERFATNLLNRIGDHAARDRCANSVNDLAMLFTFRAKYPLAGNNTNFLFTQAERLLKLSISLGQAGVTPMETRLWYLGQVQSLEGHHAEAASTYTRISEIPQTNYSRLWLESLRIDEETTKGSAEYRTAMAQALEDFAPANGKDEYEATMRHKLALSYFNAGDYTNAFQLWRTNAGKSGDPNLESYELKLSAQAAAAIGESAAASQARSNLLEKYPDSPSAKNLVEELKLSSSNAPARR